MNRPFLPTATFETIQEIYLLEFTKETEVDINSLIAGSIVKVQTRTNLHILEVGRKMGWAHVWWAAKEHGSDAGYKGKMFIHPRVRVDYNLVYVHRRDTREVFFSSPIRSIEVARIP